MTWWLLYKILKEKLYRINRSLSFLALECITSRTCIRMVTYISGLRLRYQSPWAKSSLPCWRKFFQNDCCHKRHLHRMFISSARLTSNQTRTKTKRQIDNNNEMILKKRRKRVTIREDKELSAISSNIF